VLNFLQEFLFLVIWPDSKMANYIRLFPA